MVGVGFLGVGIDDDEAGENGLSRAAKRVFVKQVGLGVRGLVNLECALVELLAGLGDGEGEHLRERTGGGESGKGFVSGLTGTEVEIERLQASVAPDHRGVRLDGEGAVAPVLFADVSKLRAMSGVEIVGAGGELGGSVVVRAEVFDHGGPGVFSENHKGMGKNGRGGADRVGEYADGQIDLHIAGDINESAIGEESFVERGELRRAEFWRLGEQVFAHESIVVHESVLKGIDDHAAGAEIGREEFAGN